MAIIGMARQPLVEQRVMRIIDTDRVSSHRVGGTRSVLLGGGVVTLTLLLAGLQFAHPLAADEPLPVEFRLIRAAATDQSEAVRTQ